MVTGQLADRPTRRQSNSPINQLADNEIVTEIYKIVWAHGCVFPVNLRKKSVALLAKNPAVLTERTAG